LRANHRPTTIKRNPLHRLTAGPVMRIGASVAALAVDTAIDAVSNNATNINAAVVIATAVAALPNVNDWAARPASSGPVHPESASRYPKP